MDNYKKTLLLAGKLAIASQKVIDSNIYDLSQNIEELEIALNNYDNAILNFET